MEGNMCLNEFFILPKIQQLSFDSNWSVWVQSTKKTPPMIEMRLRLCLPPDQITSKTLAMGDIFVDLMKPCIRTMEQKTRFVQLELSQTGLQLTCRTQPVIITQTVISALQLIFNWQDNFFHWKKAKDRVESAYSMILERKSSTALDVALSLIIKGHVRVDQKMQHLKELNENALRKELGLFVQQFKSCSFKQCFIQGAITFTVKNDRALSLLESIRNYFGCGSGLNVKRMNEQERFETLDFNHLNCILVVRISQVGSYEEKENVQSNRNVLITWAQTCLNQLNACRNQSQCLMNVYRWKTAIDRPDEWKRLFQILCLFMNQHINEFFLLNVQLGFKQSEKVTQSTSQTRQSKSLNKHRLQFFADCNSLDEISWFGICIEDRHQKGDLSYLKKLVDELLQNHMRFKVKEMAKQELEELKDNLFKRLVKCTWLDDCANCFLWNETNGQKDLRDEWARLNEISLQQFQQWSFNMLDIKSDQVQKLSIQIPRDYDGKRWLFKDSNAKLKIIRRD